MEKIRASILLNGLAPEGFDTGDAEVSLVTTDSREVCPGCIFVAFPGNDSTATTLQPRHWKPGPSVWC